MEVIGCNENRKRENLNNNKVGQIVYNLERGQTIYREKCTSCHNYQTHNNEYYPSLQQMLNMDRSVLLNKLKVLENDSLHITVIQWQDDIEKRAVKYFISNWDGISP